MASSAFDFVAAELERHTRLASLEARGTLRLALKQAGLDPRHATSAQLAVAIERVLPGELASRGIARPKEVCRSLAGALRIAHPDPESGETPESIFRRLAGE